YVSFTSPDPPEIPPLSLHDALPILRRKFLTSGQNVGDWPSPSRTPGAVPVVLAAAGVVLAVLAVLGSPSSNQAPSAPILPAVGGDRKSTRLNSSHVKISYAVFCLKK